jgi:segregation and condensation protein B
LERELIRIVGKGDGPGKPILYGTTPFFMEYFGINDLSELPKMEDIKSDINEVGTEKE